MKKIKILTMFLFFMICIQFFTPKVFAVQNTFDTDNLQKSGFTLVKKQCLSDKNAMAYYLKHKKSGAHVFYLDDGKDEKTFPIGFKTPPKDNKGANHVLEHCLMCGSKKYPSKTLSQYLRSNSVATDINAVTNDDSTNYFFKTSNKKDFYNLADVYINAVLNPSVLNDEKIFKQQGIRKEYSDGKVVYNGVVYNEQRLNNFETKENTINFVVEKMYTNLFGNTVPAFNSGGNVDAIPNLKYCDILNVYKKYYTPSNSLICISGNQDILQTLSLLNSYLKNYKEDAPNIAWNYSAVKTKSPVYNYNITDKTKKVDIGFLYSGPAITKVRESYAYEVLLYAIQKKIRANHPNVYILPAITGGISNFGIIVSDVPINEKDKVISNFTSLNQNNISRDELNSAIDKVEENKSSYFITEASELALNGFVYDNNPFLFLNKADDFNYLKDNPSYFKKILNKYIINNPYKNIVVSGHIAKSKENNEIKVSSNELTQIKKDTENFNAWVEEKDTPETLAKLPVLSLDDFKEDKLQKKEGQNEKFEKLSDVNYYATLDDSANTSYANIYFQLPEFDEDLRYAALMTRYLNYKFSSMGIDNVSFDLAPFGNFFNENDIDPRFIISFSYNKTNIEENTIKVIKLLNDNRLFSIKDLEKFLQQENKKSKMISLDPYHIFYDMMMSSQNKSDKFWTTTLGYGNSGNGSMLYFNFIKQAIKTPENNNQRISKLNNIFKNTINKNNLIISYNGNTEGYNTFKKVTTSSIKNMNKKSRAAYSKVPKLGYNSAIILSNKKDNVSQIMQIGNMYKTNYKYSGKMSVLGNVLTSKYLLPILRNKMGAYCGSIYFENSNVVFSTAGVKDIDKTLKVFAGAGDYIRNLSMTQKELDSIIISTLNEFDEYYNSDYYYFEYKQLYHYTLDDLKIIRQEILNTTVDDIKNYADFVDSITAQKSVFVIANNETANKTSFPFECTVNPSSLTIIQNSNKNTQ